MHIRHGERWNCFREELIPKVYTKCVQFVDIIESINLFINIYFGLLVRDAKSINDGLEEKDITSQIKLNIKEVLKVRNRYIHVDYKKTGVTNNGKEIIEPMNFAFVQNVKNELGWIENNQMNINDNDFNGIKNMLKFIIDLIDSCRETANANKFKVIETD